MKTRNLASGASFWNCMYVSVSVYCVFSLDECVYMLWCVCERVPIDRIILPSPRSKICCFDFMAWSIAIPSLDMFFVVVVVHSFFASFIFVFCRSQCRVRVSFFFFYLLFHSFYICSCFQELPQSLFV